MSQWIQPYDVAMLAVLVIMLAVGVWKGMAWQLAALGSVVISAGVAVHFSAPLAPMFGSNEPWNRFLAMLVLYVDRLRRTAAPLTVAPE